MTAQTKAILKSYFNTGDIPTEAQFANLIDSAERAFYPEDYGAVGDGTTDDTVAFQAAIDAAAAAGGGVIRADKSYGISLTTTTTFANYPVSYGLHVNNNNVFIVGGGTIKPLTDDEYFLIAFGNGGAPLSHPGEDGTWVYNVGVSGLTFDGMGTTAVVCPMLFSYVKGFYATLNRILNFGGCGIKGMACPREGKIIGNTITNCGSSINNTPIIYLDGGRYCVISSNIIDTATKGIGITVQANLDNGASGVCSYNTISNNVIKDMYSAGIQVVGFQYGIVTGNYLYNVAPGIWLRAYATTAGSAETSYNTITNNYIYRSTTTGTGIVLDEVSPGVAATYARFNIIANNLIDGHFTTGMSYDTTYCIPNFVHDNIWDTPGAFTADDATPSVMGYDVWTTANANATTITMLDNGYVGQRVTVIVNDALTTVDFTGTNLKGNGGADWSPASGDFMNCVFDGTNWYCDVVDVTA